MLAVGGSRTRRLQTFGVAALATFAMFAFLQLTDWWLNPQIGPILLAVLGAATALAVTAVLAGLQNRRALYAALTAVALGVVMYFPMQAVFDSIDESNWILFAGSAC